MMSTPRLLSIKTIPRLTASLASRPNTLLQTRPTRTVQRPFSRLVFAMTSQTSQNLDKSTPESTWQQILSTDQVGLWRSFADTCEHSTSGCWFVIHNHCLCHVFTCILL